MFSRGLAALWFSALVFGPVAFGQGTPVLPLTDFSGVWGETVHEDNYERSGGPPLGDYQGIPLNDAGRRKADSHDHEEWSLPEFQCRPHSAPYQWRALGSVRFWNEVDPLGRDLTAIHVEYLRSLDRVIYMDGRPHPADYAPHSWSGFSTGHWEGNTLVIDTTHIKGSYLRRNGASFTDNATMTEFIDRHGDILTITMILTDPIWLEEPFHSNDELRLRATFGSELLPVHRQRGKYLYRRSPLLAWHHRTFEGRRGMDSRRGGAGRSGKQRTLTIAKRFGQRNDQVNSLRRRALRDS